MLDYILTWLTEFLTKNGATAPLIAGVAVFVRILAAGVIVLIGYIGIRILKSASVRANKKYAKLPQTRERKLRTYSAIIYSAVKYFICIVVMFKILGLFGIDNVSITAFWGAFGVALGLGFQSAVKDIIQGVFFVMEDQFGVGDEVTLSGVSGEVRYMGLRTITICEKNGVTHIIPNSGITVVTNRSRKKAEPETESGSEPDGA